MITRTTTTDHYVSGSPFEVLTRQGMVRVAPGRIDIAELLATHEASRTGICTAGRAAPRVELRLQAHAAARGRARRAIALVEQMLTKSETLRRQHSVLNHVLLDAVGTILGRELRARDERLAALEKHLSADCRQG